uniref:Uncharacterized protein n=1 Tax=Pithovirus LCPAC104 TaxID=2506589 RepID=A0A481Z3Q0_9VIRU|nr:MAG: hypothetical protein LCPAC104_00240 [Pithovirus LCPAC104]
MENHLPHRLRNINKGEKLKENINKEVRIEIPSSPSFVGNKEKNTSISFKNSNGYKLLEETERSLNIRKTQVAKSANFFRLANIFVTIAVVAIAITIGIIASLSESISNSITILSFSIVGLKSTYEMFKLGTRGIYLKYVVIRFENIINNIQGAKFIFKNDNEFMHFNNSIREEISNLDLEIFKLHSGPDSINIDFEGNVNFTK